MLPDSSDTIYALSSGAAKSGVAVIRVSGSHARFVSETMTGSLPVERVAALKSIRTRNGDLIDHGVVIFFAGPRSFTGEDVLEFQVHGSRAVVTAMLDELSSFSDVRTAEPGEFTLRAFQNGKLDLVAAEALADLIDAETEAQRKLALRQMDGTSSRIYADWRDRLLAIRALIEAEIDFSDEGDVAEGGHTPTEADLRMLAGEMRAYVSGFKRAQIIRDGFRVVLVGRPNSGKSSLLNALVRKEAAIVSEEPGTTRDVIEVALDLGGFKVIFTDTAGIREAESQIERVGIQRARDSASSADLLIELRPAGDRGIDLQGANGQHWIIGSKADLGTSPTSDFWVSAQSGTGLDDLLSRIEETVRISMEDGSPGTSQLRHADLISQSLTLIGEAIAERGGLEFQAELIRRATDRIAEITGEIGTEDVLGAIFSRFCIGK